MEVVAEDQGSDLSVERADLRSREMPDRPPGPCVKFKTGWPTKLVVS